MISAVSVPPTTATALPGANLGDAKFVLSSGVTVADEASSGKEFFDGAKLKRSSFHDEAAKALNDVSVIQIMEIAVSSGACSADRVNISENN